MERGGIAEKLGRALTVGADVLGTLLIYYI